MLAIKQDEIELQLSKAETLNRFLVNLTRENVLSTTPDHETTRRSAKHYKSIREHAKIMADTLQSKLLSQKCLCQLTHNASLALEVRSERKRAKDNRFRVLFGFDAGTHQPPWNSHEMEIHVCETLLAAPVEIVIQQDNQPVATPATTIQAISDQLVPKTSSKIKEKRSFKRFFRSSSPGINVSRSPSPTLQPPQIPLATEQARNVVLEIPQHSKGQTKAAEIENLCTAISSAEDIATWCGVLRCESNILQHIKIASKSSLAPESTHFVSLADLLSTELWKTKSRSKLGLKLASTVLQLCQTPWLGDHWGKEDIFFIQQGDGTVLTDRPFLKPHFPLPAAGQKQIGSVAGTINMHVPTLFALGVVLIELHFKKSIDELQKQEGGVEVNPAEVCCHHWFEDFRLQYTRNQRYFISDGHY